MHPVILLNAILALLLILPEAFARTTWDEPWQKEVVANADTLVRAEILVAAPGRVEFKVLKHIVGAEIPATGALVGFSKLNFVSYSVKEDVFGFRKGEVYYLFLEKADKKMEYNIATPTSGFAVSKNGTTTATFRHSLHKAYATDELYEMSMIAIFKTLKRQKTELSELKRYIQTQLKKKPVGTPEFEQFCEQHVALELLYYLGGGELDQLEPFLNHDDLHVQASAVRALGKLPRKVCQERLLGFITDSEKAPFARVLAVWALRDLKAYSTADKLGEIIESSDDHESSMGCALMDPRIGTHFPNSVHDGIRSLLKKWKNEAKDNPDEDASASSVPSTEGLSREGSTNR